MSFAIQVSEDLQQFQPLLWSLSYRMTGSHADAEDIVQETFARVLERPPEDTERSLRPWLIRVAMNLSRDMLRKRKQQAYVGPWLPAPIEQEEAFVQLETQAPDQEAHYSLRETATLAFLLALEVLSPTQRAVLLLRDVFDYPVKETAALLELSTSNVKTTHHRARQLLQSYDEDRCSPEGQMYERTKHALEQFMACMVSGEHDKLEELLCEDVRMFSDSGGRYYSALRPIVGRDNVLRFYIHTTTRGKVNLVYMDIRDINGLPAIVMQAAPQREREAPRFITGVRVDTTGRIKEFYAIMADDKLDSIHFPS
ncbi:MAG: RNA polymerase subunit sigma [Deltaproteobacteria bacterium]|nr:RNA polymerase subunit sigma [Deltaproteobacteria bacterium]MBU53990.1 RNA polymerase subunit sigma [Deltaproteobacteria bacterium]